MPTCRRSDMKISSQTYILLANKEKRFENSGLCLNGIKFELLFNKRQALNVSGWIHPS